MLPSLRCNISLLELNGALPCPLMGKLSRQRAFALRTRRDLVATKRKMTNDLLPKLSRWFAAHCDGEREHHRGISIVTTDNPGWWVKIDLGRTELVDRDFATVSENIDAAGFPEGSRWLHCCLKDGEWHGAGDETCLEQIIATFLAWAES